MTDERRASWKRWEHRLAKLAVFATVGSFCILMYVLYRTFNPVQVIVLNAYPMRVITTENYRGSIGMTYEIDYCKHVDVIATLARELVATDGRDLVVMLPLVAGALPIGCHLYHATEMIPTYVPPGRYKLRVTRMYRMSVHYDIPPVLETQEFEVK